MASPDATEKDIWQTLTALELSDTIRGLENGLDTPLSPLGNPLNLTAFLLLKLAAAILSKPCVIILNQHFDAVPDALRQRLLSYLSAGRYTVLYFTSMPTGSGFTKNIHLDKQAALQPVVSNQGALS